MQQEAKPEGKLGSWKKFALSRALAECIKHFLTSYLATADTAAWEAQGD